jgi:ABC-2 type transport system ATP-binding protein
MEGVATIVSERNGIFKIQLAAGVDSSNLLRFLLDQGIRLRAFREVLPSLNEIFIRQVNQV